MKGSKQRDLGGWKREYKGPGLDVQLRELRSGKVQKRQCPLSWPRQEGTERILLLRAGFFFAQG